MAKYRKKPVVVEAVKFNEIGDHPEVHGDLRSPTGFAIHTLENTKIKHEVTPGDWIITGISGEYYPCKDHIFRETCELADPVTVTTAPGTEG